MIRSRKGPWRQTASGKAFYLLDPRPEDIEIEDIAHALGNLCRFGGHSRSFYSVAQHSVLVLQCAPVEHARWALMHDAAEGYIGDTIAPLKDLVPLLSAIEDGILQAIAARFDLPWPVPPEVRHADLRVLATEARDVMRAAPQPWQSLSGIEPLPEKIIPTKMGEHACNAFLRRWRGLWPDERYTVEYRAARRMKRDMNRLVRMEKQASRHAKSHL